MSESIVTIKINPSTTKESAEISASLTRNGIQHSIRESEIEHYDSGDGSHIATIIELSLVAFMIGVKPIASVIIAYFKTHPSTSFDIETPGCKIQRITKANAASAIEVLKVVASSGQGKPSKIPASKTKRK